MRLGKTLTSIWWLAEKKDAKRILVVAPNSVVGAWQDEITVERQTSVVLTGTAIQRAEAAISSSARWHLINHEGLTAKGVRTSSGKKKATATHICKLPWDAVVIDESDCIKNPTANITKIATTEFADVKYRAILSGLPNPEHESLDLFAQMKFLNGKLLGETSFWEFRDKYYYSDLFGREWHPRQGVQKAIRDEIVRSCFLLTRKDAGLGNVHDLHVRKLDVPETIRTEIMRAEKEMAVGDKETVWPMVARGWQLQLLGGRIIDLPRLHHDAKLKELEKIVVQEMPREKIVVWFRFTAEIEAARTLFSRKNVFATVLDGNVSVDVRHARVKSFRAGYGPRVALCQYQAMMYGVDLSAADINVYYSLPDSQKQFYQSRERIESLAKHVPLLDIHLAVRDSLDEDIHLALKIKRASSQMFINDVTSRLLERVKARVK